MADLLKKPFGTRGKVHQITPQSAGWRYVGFSLYRLRAGDTAAELTGDNEVILVMVEGKATISAGGEDFGEQGQRMNVFEQLPPHSVYVPNGSDWSATAVTDCTIGVCTAPGNGGHKAFSGNTGRFLVRLRDTFFAQPIDSGFHIAICFVQGFFTVHHACAGFFTQFFDHCGSDRHGSSP